MFESIEHHKKRAFLTTYAETGVVKDAAELVGISREAHYDWKASDPEYAAAFEQAARLATDALEDEARRRGFRGSDKLLMFLLERLNRERFGKQVEQKHTGEVRLAHGLDLAHLADEELDALERIINHARGGDHAGSDSGRETTPQA